MIGYFDLFPDKTKTELRTAHLIDDSPHGIPVGIYLFTEYFCRDLTCDCRRVLIKVLWAASPTDMPGEVATISFTWNEEPAQSSNSLIEVEDNPFLDPFHHQCTFADELKDFWFYMYQGDGAYADRIKRHYAEVRDQAASACTTHAAEVRVDGARRESVAERKRRYRSLRHRTASKKSHRKS